jgi:sugar (pentulose or hexulose) kinase
MMQNLASGIRENIPLITMEMDKVSGILANGISGNQLLTSAGVGELNIAGAAAEFKAPTINQKQEQVIIQAGNVFATEGEMREFARSLENYRKIEAQRSGAEN